ncbi:MULTISPECIES: TlpA family protein disulfide reductase [Flexivirga]
MNRPAVRRRHMLLAVLGLAGTGALAGCGTTNPDSVAAQAQGGDQKGYVAGDGTVAQIAQADRGKPLQLSGATIDGATWSLAGRTGGVVVNVWGSWCPPCIQETPDLKKAYTRLRAARPGVAFVGVDIKESAASAQSFVVKNRIPYPSLAYEGGKSLLALHGMAPATPTTLVLDQQGRIAARVLGPVDATTLVGLVQDVIPSTPAAGTR